MSELIETLKRQAKEIADAGHNGWGNTMLMAAEALEQERQAGYAQEREAMLVEALKPFMDIVLTTQGRIATERLSLANWHGLIKAATNSTEHTERFMAEVKAKTLEDLVGNFSDALVRDFILGLANELREMK